MASDREFRGRQGDQPATSLSRLVAVTGTCYGPARKAIPAADLAMRWLAEQSGTDPDNVLRRSQQLSVGEDSCDRDIQCSADGEDFDV